MSRDKKGWVSGHLLWIKPEHRGRDLARRAYFPAVLDLALERGAKGFRFLSTLDRWKGCKIFNQELYLRQSGGPDVWAYWHRV